MQRQQQRKNLPGTGKTQIAKTLANMSGVTCVFKNANDMIGEVVGKSPKLIAKIFADARDKSPCILFLDEFEAARALAAFSVATGDAMLACFESKYS